MTFNPSIGAIVELTQQDSQLLTHSSQKKMQRWAARLSGMGTVLEILPPRKTFTAAEAIRKSERLLRSALARASAANLAAISTTNESTAAVQAAKKHAEISNHLTALMKELTKERKELTKERAKLMATINTAVKAAGTAAVEAAMQQAIASAERHLTEIERMRQRLFEPAFSAPCRSDSAVAEHV